MVDQGTLRIKLNIGLQHIKYRMSHINLTYTIADIADGFGHNANIFGYNMNEYRHMAYRIHFCPWNNFTDGTPYY